MAPMRLSKASYLRARDIHGVGSGARGQTGIPGTMLRNTDSKSLLQKAGLEDRDCSRAFA